MYDRVFARYNSYFRSRISSTSGPESHLRPVTNLIASSLWRRHRGRTTPPIELLGPVLPSTPAAGVATGRDGRVDRAPTPTTAVHRRSQLPRTPGVASTPSPTRLVAPHSPTSPGCLRVPVPDSFHRHPRSRRLEYVTHRRSRSPTRSSFFRWATTSRLGLLGW